jgi:hypothetical protein
MICRPEDRCRCCAEPLGGCSWALMQALLRPERALPLEAEWQRAQRVVGGYMFRNKGSARGEGNEIAPMRETMEQWTVWLKGGLPEVSPQLPCVSRSPH